MTRKQLQVLDHERDLLVENVDAALHRLASAGFGPFEGLKFLLDRMGMSLREAKKRVHCSGAWRHLDASIEQLHGDAEAAAEELERENRSRSAAPSSRRK